MKLVCILAPALIAFSIRKKRGYMSGNPIDTVIAYGLWTLIINFISMSIVAYVIGINDVNASALDSFGFATKYIVISAIVAVIMPYIVEILSKYISVSFSIETSEEDDEKKE